MASIAEILEAFFAGIYVEMKIVKIETALATIRDNGVITTDNFASICIAS